MSARVLQVIESDELRGKGETGDPYRRVLIYYAFDGTLLASNDTWEVNDLKNKLDAAEARAIAPNASPVVGECFLIREIGALRMIRDVIKRDAFHEGAWNIVGDDEKAYIVHYDTTRRRWVTLQLGGIVDAAPANATPIVGEVFRTPAIGDTFRLWEDPQARLKVVSLQRVAIDGAWSVCAEGGDVFRIRWDNKKGYWTTFAMIAPV